MKDFLESFLKTTRIVITIFALLFIMAICSFWLVTNLLSLSILFFVFLVLGLLYGVLHYSWRIK